MSDDYKELHTNNGKESNDQQLSLVIGTAILLTNNRTGIIRYRGTIAGDEGYWFGVELIAGSADRRGNNGVKRRRRYFFAPKGKAVFVRKKEIKKVLNKSTKSHFFNIVDPAERIEVRSPQEWTTNDVCRWLAKNNVMDAITIFLVHGIVGTTLLKLSPEDLEYRLGIKDKNLINQLLKAKERLLAQTAILPDLREDDVLVLDDIKELGSDTIKAPVLKGLDGRNRALSSPASRPKKRDSYSIPERQRGKVRSAKSRNARKTKKQFSPKRGSFRSSLQPMMKPAMMVGFKSTPVITHHGIQEYEDEKLTLDDIGDYSLERESGDNPIPSMKQIEDTLMKHWTCDIVATWLNGLGEQAGSYSELFRKKEITGSVLMCLKSDSIEALGVKQPAVRQWILASRDILLTKQATVDLIVE